MPCAVAGLVFGAVDVAADDTVEVAPADDETEGDATFIDAFGVVGGPVSMSDGLQIQGGSGQEIYQTTVLAIQG